MRIPATLKLKRTITIMVLMVLWLGYKIFHQKEATPEAPPAPLVSVQKINPKNWTQTFTTVGTLQASQSVLIQSEVAGVIEKVTFETGQSVTEGESLVMLKSDDIAADLDKDKATLLNDDTKYHRLKSLLPSKYIAAADIDSSLAKVKEDMAQVNKDEALLNKYTIKAPFSGQLGIKQISIGQYLKVGDVIVNCEQLTPMYLDFTVPESEASLIKKGITINFTTGAYPNQTFHGIVIGTNQRIDAESRALSVRASVPNDQHQLLTGMSAAITVNESTQEALVIPQSALLYEPEGAVVYVIDNKNIAHKKSLTLGEHKGDDVVVLKGLETNSQLVIAGGQKLSEGKSVRLASEGVQ